MNKVNLDFKGYIQSDLWRTTNEVREIQQKSAELLLWSQNIVP